MNQKAKDEFLLYCVGMKAYEMEASELEQLSPYDWNEIIQQSERHRITPLLYRRLSLVGLDALIPAKVKEGLQKINLHSTLRNAQKYNELSKVVNLLKHDNTPVILLKGISLADLVYQTIALRPMTDIDLLVKYKDIQKVDKALLQLGYESEIVSSLERHEQWMKHVTYVKRLEGADDISSIDIHTRLFEIPDLDPWLKTSRVNINSIDALMLGAEDLLLHLCVHLHFNLSRNGESRLLWWHDIAKVLEYYQNILDWDYIMQAIQKYHIGKPVYHVLRAASEWFNVDVPAKVLQPTANKDPAISITDVLHPTVVMNDPEVKQLISSISAVSRIPAVHSRIYYVFRRLIPDREFMMDRYSISRPKLVYLYYPMRLIQGGWTALKTLYRLPAYIKKRHSF